MIEGVETKFAANVSDRVLAHLKSLETEPTGLQVDRLEHSLRTELGMSMFPDVWHTSPLPVEGSQEYENTQECQYHHATVDYDFSSEDVVLEVPLDFA